MISVIQIRDKLLSNATEHPLKVVLMILNGIKTLDSNSITASKASNDKRTFHLKIHMIY